MEFLYHSFSLFSGSSFALLSMDCLKPSRPLASLRREVLQRRHCGRSGRYNAGTWSQETLLPQFPAYQDTCLQRRVSHRPSYDHVATGRSWPNWSWPPTACWGFPLHCLAQVLCVCSCLQPLLVTQCPFLSAFSICETYCISSAVQMLYSSSSWRIMFCFPTVICTRCTGFFCFAIIKGHPMI